MPHSNRKEMEIEHYRTMSFDEYLDEMISSPDYKSLEGDELNSVRSVMTFYYWKVVQQD